MYNIYMETPVTESLLCRSLYNLIARGDHQKTIKVIRIFRAKCTPVTGIAKGILTITATRNPNYSRQDIIL